MTKAVQELLDALHEPDKISQLHTDLELDQKSDLGHIHPISSIVDLRDELDNKSDVGHIHEISDVNNLQDELDSKANDTDVTTIDQKIDDHIADVANPHVVTKDQVGLGNVDNTSDLLKPISYATQNALDEKSDKNHNHNGAYYRLDGSTEITAPLSGGGQQIHNIINGTELNHGSTVGQVYDVIDDSLVIGRFTRRIKDGK